MSLTLKQTDGLSWRGINPSWFSSFGGGFGQTVTGDPSPPPKRDLQTVQMALRSKVHGGFIQGKISATNVFGGTPGLPANT